jgi:hypothetical protein
LSENKQFQGWNLIDRARWFRIVESQSIDIPRNHLKPSETIWNHLKPSETICPEGIPMGEQEKNPSDQWTDE